MGSSLEVLQEGIGDHAAARFRCPSGHALCRDAQIPDGDGRTLGQPLPSALQPRVDLPHLHGALQPHHLQQVVTEVCEK